MKSRVVLFSCIAFLLTAASPIPAQMPDFYNRVDRVTWIVKSTDGPVRAWSQLGLTDIRSYPQETRTVSYRGAPLKVGFRRVSGDLGDLGVDFIQPGGGAGAFTNFLARHGDGIFALVYKVPSEDALARETARLAGAGVHVLQTLTLSSPGGASTYTFFDTESQGKYVLGLVYESGTPPSRDSKRVISHIAPVIRESQSVSAYWQSLGFPALEIDHATPRADSRYRGKPLTLSFDVGWQRFSQQTLEWIIPPVTPPNIYADFLRLHGEGIQHMGMPVDDLQQAVKRFQALGYTVWQSGAWGDVGKKDSGQYDYMNTNAVGGVVIELIHAH